MKSKIPKSVAVIVAHPDDETLWAGGTILCHPSWKCFTVSICRGSDTDRSPRFYRALKILKSEGIMGDMDDGPGQNPLKEKEIERIIIQLLPPTNYDLIISHNPSGEYTRHIRHEEVSKAVINLWHAGEISATRLWTFAYEDGKKEYYPRPVGYAPVYQTLTDRIWQLKYRIITETYGFEKGSFEAETTPTAEAFWQFTDPGDAIRWLNKFENLRMR
jgi:LmbE family N-acetylglucosaminyl deacetylase